MVLLYVDFTQLSCGFHVVVVYDPIFVSQLRRVDIEIDFKIVCRLLLPGQTHPVCVCVCVCVRVCVCMDDVHQNVNNMLRLKNENGVVSNRLHVFAMNHLCFVTKRSGAIGGQCFCKIVNILVHMTLEP